MTDFETKKSRSSRDTQQHALLGYRRLVDLLVCNICTGEYIGERLGCQTPVFGPQNMLY